MQPSMQMTRRAHHMGQLCTRLRNSWGSRAVCVLKQQKAAGKRQLQLQYMRTAAGCCMCHILPALVTPACRPRVEKATPYTDSRPGTSKKPQSKANSTVVAATHSAPACPHIKQVSWRACQPPIDKCKCFPRTDAQAGKKAAKHTHTHTYTHTQTQNTKQHMEQARPHALPSTGVTKHSTPPSHLLCHLLLLAGSRQVSLRPRQPPLGG